MAIALNFVTDQGVTLKYGRISEIRVDFKTSEAKAIIGGYTSLGARLSNERPTPTPFVAQFKMPEVAPENLIAHAYETLKEQYPEQNFEEI
jgi:hypothetical protein